MCSWCWAFRPSLLSLLERLPKTIEVIRLLGGLAPDSEEVMTEETKQYVQGHWRAIEKQVPMTKFNYDFWVTCEPIRSTYPSCRAVIAARRQGVRFDAEMTFAIQQAYYLHARNPSLSLTLIELSEELGLDEGKFLADLKSTETDETLRLEIKQARRLGLNSFPSLLLESEESYSRIKIDYLNTGQMLDEVNRIIEG